MAGSNPHQPAAPSRNKRTPRQADLTQRRVTQYAQPQAQLRSTLRGKPDDEINPSTVTQNVQFRLPPVLIRPEPKAVQIGRISPVKQHAVQITARDVENEAPRRRSP